MARSQIPRDHPRASTISAPATWISGGFFWCRNQHANDREAADGHPLFALEMRTMMGAWHTSVALDGWHSHGHEGPHCQHEPGVASAHAGTKGSHIVPGTAGRPLGEPRYGNNLAASDRQLLTRLLATPSGSLLGKPSLPPARIGTQSGTYLYDVDSQSGRAPSSLLTALTASPLLRLERGKRLPATLNHTCSFWQSIKGSLLTLSPRNQGFHAWATGPILDPAFLEHLPFTLPSPLVFVRPPHLDRGTSARLVLNFYRVLSATDFLI